MMYALGGVRYAIVHKENVTLTNLCIDILTSNDETCNAIITVLL